MRLLVIYHWIESHCCPYLFNDVLFPTGNEWRGCHIPPQWQVIGPSWGLQLKTRSETWWQLSQAHALCLWNPVWTAQGQGLECPFSSGRGGKTLFLRGPYSYLLSASAGGVVKSSLVKQHFIPYFEVPIFLLAIYSKSVFHLTSEKWVRWKNR